MSEPAQIKCGLAILRCTKNLNHLRYRPNGNPLNKKYPEIIRDTERSGSLDGLLERHYLTVTNYGVFRINMQARVGLEKAAEQNEVTLYFAISDPVPE